MQRFAQLCPSPIEIVKMLVFRWLNQKSVHPEQTLAWSTDEYSVEMVQRFVPFSQD